MNSKVPVAIAQIAPVFLNIQKSISKACSFIEKASKAGAELVVFPEAFISGYPDWVWLIPNSKGAELNRLYSKLVQNSIQIGDEHTNTLCQTAKKFKINVAIGINERNSETSGASLFNTLLFIDKEGEIMGKHRKLIPTGGERLIWGQGSGETLRTYSSSIGKIGGLICWENFMPLARTALYEQGIQILLAPTWDKSPNWLQTMQHNAREGGGVCAQRLHGHYQR